MEDMSITDYKYIASSFFEQLELHSPQQVTATHAIVV